MMASTYSDKLSHVSLDVNGETLDLVGGSFRGVSFNVLNLSRSGGRNVVSKTIPFSDLHINEDTGKKVPSLSVPFYLIGENCEAQREKLEAAFCKSGAGELIHPNYGKIQARASDYSISFSSDVSEYIEGSVTFIPETDPSLTNYSEDFGGETKTASAEALEKASDRFSEVFSIAGKCQAVIDAVNEKAESIISAIDVARNSIRSVYAFVDSISKLKADLSIIMDTPTDFAARIQNLLTMTKETLGIDGGSAKDVVKESLTIMSSYSSAEASSADAEDLENSMSELVLLSASAALVSSLVDCDFDSAEEAQEFQDNVHSGFDAAIDDVSSMEALSTLQDLEANALKYLRDTISTLPDVITYKLNGPADVLTVCFDIYGNLDKVDDLISRNAIDDPLFIDRESLKVLSK
jgi:prophage DNA circulation protein